MAITLTLSSSGARWFNTLFTSLTFSLIGVAVPNFYKQSGNKSRAHNGAKFLNEFLARHLLVYVTFFMALALTADFKKGAEGVKVWLTLIVGATLLGYLFGIYLSSTQDRFFTRHHKCFDNPECDKSVAGNDIWSLCWPNALMAIALLILACLAVFLVV